MADKTAPTAETKTANPFQIPGLPAMPALPGAAEAMEMWTRAMADQQARFGAMMDEMAKGEERAHAEAKKAVEEMSRLSMAGLDYARELSGHMRRLALENMKKAAEASKPQAKA